MKRKGGHVAGISQQPVAVDLLIEHAIIVTMDANRTVIKDGALAVTKDRIVAVGKTDDLKAKYYGATTINARRFVIAPGMVNCHIHITGEPLTRGYVPDDVSFDDHVFQWLAPIHRYYTHEDERLSGQLAALEMLKSGTTSFIEAGSLEALDEVADGLNEIGIRGRIALRVWDQAMSNSHKNRTTDEAVRMLTDELVRYPCRDGTRIAAWPTLVGHTLCTDELWRSAKALADANGTGMTFHMSPMARDGEWHLEKFGRRPVEHLADIGILGENVVITHLVHISQSEIDILAETNTNVAHCPTTSLKVGYGVTRIGKFPEMAAKGVNVGIGTDGNNGSNYSDLMRATYLVAGLYKDARGDASLFPAEEAFAMATLNGARAIGLEKDIGSLEVGKKADFVFHDTNRPEWRPLLNVANQLVWAADGRGVHSVWVDGVRVVDNYQSTMIDEERFYAEVQVAGEAIVKRSGLPDHAKWPTI
jgi:cytosine/adenosine deaminase-related metal-dependent hydrolase